MRLDPEQECALAQALGALRALELLTDARGAGRERLNVDCADLGWLLALIREKLETAAPRKAA